MRNPYTDQVSDHSVVAVAEYPIKVGVTPHCFASLGHQKMTCMQLIEEAVDNAIAAAQPGSKPQVCIAWAADKERAYYWLAVADWGRGMDTTELERAMQLGSVPESCNRLNEHGVGLDTLFATCDCVIFTHRREENVYHRLAGPLGIEMTIKDVHTPDLPAGLNLKWRKPSTILLMRLPLHVAQSLQGRGCKATDLYALRSWQVEHLGVAYRGYLEADPRTHEPGAKIIVTIGDDAVSVPAIQAPIADEHIVKIPVELGGQVVQMEYRYGHLDEHKRDTLIDGEKCRYYYQGNQPTQGLDVRCGNRVLATGLLPEVWSKPDGSPLARHNRFNSFVGELKIPSLPRGVLPTLINKTGLDYNDADWHKIVNLLADYPPLESANKADERVLQTRLMAGLKAADSEALVTDEETVWPTGTRIDVLQESNERLVIYEMKVAPATPLHLYQLKMYWDGLVIAGRQPTEGVLLVPFYDSTLEKMVAIMNEMPAPYFPSGEPSGPYHLTIATHADKNLL